MSVTAKGKNFRANAGNRHGSIARDGFLGLHCNRALLRIKPDQESHEVRKLIIAQAGLIACLLPRLLESPKSTEALQIHNTKIFGKLKASSGSMAKTRASPKLEKIRPVPSLKSSLLEIGLMMR